MPNFIIVKGFDCSNFNLFSHSISSETKRLMLIIRLFAFQLTMLVKYKTHLCRSIDESPGQDRIPVLSVSLLFPCLDSTKISTGSCIFFFLFIGSLLPSWLIIINWQKRYRFVKLEEKDLRFQRYVLSKSWLNFCSRKKLLNLSRQSQNQESLKIVALWMWKTPKPRATLRFQCSCNTLCRSWMKRIQWYSLCPISVVLSKSV